MKKVRLILCSFLALLMMVLTAPVITKAATEPVCLKKATLRYLKWTNYVVDGREKFSTIAWDPLYIGNLSGSAVITNIKSSNKHFTARKGVGVNAIYVEEKPDYVIKDGIKTTISFNVTQNGRTYKLSSRITFKPYGAFFKSFKLGTKDYASDVSGYRLKKMSPLKRNTGKIQITPSNGYKIDEIIVNYPNKSRKVKNGSNISLKNVRKISVWYHTTKKPAYYQNPGKDYRGWTGSPLNYCFDLSF